MHIDIFKGDAFALASLSKAMIDTPHQPMRISQLGLFKPEPISTTVVSIEKKADTISLVPSAPRGSVGKVVTEGKRNMRNFNVVHLPQRVAVLADEVQNLRAFGKETELELAQTVMSRKLAIARRDLDTTIEWQRMGAIKGQVLDADGTTVLLDLYTEFGVAQQTLDMELDVDATKVKLKILDIKRKIEDALGGLMYSGIRVLCSPEFFDDFIGHPAVEKAFERHQENSFAREDQRKGFEFVDCIWEEYRGTVGGQRFIAEGEAYAIPEGVSDLFITHYAPADYMETVNTLGLPYYAKREMMPFDKGVDVETQSNPLNMCTRPRVIIKLTAS